MIEEEKDQSFKEIATPKKPEKLEFTINMKNLVDAGIQFGHDPSYTHHKMIPYLFVQEKGVKKGTTQIIDLDKTIILLESACKFLETKVSRGDSVLWIGTRSNAAPIIEEQAKRSGGYFINHKWFGGLLTNFKTVLDTLKKRVDMEKLCESFKEGHKVITKKEFNSKRNTIRKNEVLYKGIEHMKKIPDIIILADRDEKRTIIKEANKLRIPVIKICDTNSSPEGVKYVIPSNDDSTKSIQCILAVLGDFCVSGAKLRALKPAVEHKKPFVQMPRRAPTGI